MAEDDDITTSVFNDVCLACSDRCKTCMEEADRCTSCHEGRVLNGSTCIGTTVVGMVQEIEEAFSQFLEGGKSEELIKFLIEFLKVSDKEIIINSIREGSTIIDCIVSTDSPAQA